MSGPGEKRESYAPPPARCVRRLCSTAGQPTPSTRITRQVGTLERTRNSQNLELVFSDCEPLGDQAVIISKDANASMRRSSLLSAVFHAGRQRGMGSIRNGEPTCCKDTKRDRNAWGPRVSRPELLVADALAKDMAGSFRGRRHLGLKTHLGLQI